MRFVMIPALLVLLWGCSVQPVRTGPMPSDTRIMLEQMGAVRVK